MTMKTMEDPELIELVERVYHQVYIAECFGSRDVQELQAGQAELELRGYTIDESSQIHISREVA